MDILNVTGDLILAHYIKNSKLNHSLSIIYREYLNLDVSDFLDLSLQNNNNKNWNNFNNTQLFNNISIIVSNLIKLESIITNSFTIKELKLYREVELPLVRVLLDIENTGFKIQKNGFNNLKVELLELLQNLEKSIFVQSYHTI